MSVKRIPNWQYPHDGSKWERIHHLEHEEESAERLRDFDSIVFANKPYYDCRDYATFSDAIDDIGSVNGTLLISEQENVIASKTVPANVALLFFRDGILNISSGKTVTISGDIQAGLYQIFKGSGIASPKRGTLLVPQWWGALGDGSTDDTAAFQKMFTALVLMYDSSEASYRITGQARIPAGRYIVTDRVIDDLDWATMTIEKARLGFRLVGDHWRSTVLELKTGGSESWFYNNGVDNGIMQQIHFEHMTFLSDDADYGNGFKFWSAGCEKQFHWENCRFIDLDDLMWTHGTGNADLTNMVRCLIDIQGDVLVLNNAQSVQHDFVGCDIHTYGDIIKIMAIGGGNVNISNGHIDFDWDDVKSPATGNFFVNVLDTATGVALGNMTFTFRDCRCEINASYANDASTAPPFGLVWSSSATTDPSYPKILFDNINFVGGKTEDLNTSIETFRKITAVTLYPRKRVDFRDCVLLKSFYYFLGGVYTTGSPNIGPIIKMTDCFDGIEGQLPSGESANANIHKRVTIDSTAGRFSTFGMYDHTTGGGKTRFLTDYDQGWLQSTGREPSMMKKIFSFKHSSIRWPRSYTDADDITVDIPPGFIPFRTYVYKPAYGATATSYMVHIGSDNDQDFVDGDVTPASDQINIDGHGYVTADACSLTTTGTVPAGLTKGVVYYIIRIDDDNFQLAASAADAGTSTQIDITAAAGGGTHTIKGPILLSSTSTADEWKDAHTIDAELTDFSSYTGLMMWATGTSTSFQSGGYGYLEYV